MIRPCFALTFMSNNIVTHCHSAVFCNKSKFIIGRTFQPLLYTTIICLVSRRDPTEENMSYFFQRTIVSIYARVAI